jgi:hypothetical protein
MMEKSNTILDFFKRKNAQTSNAQSSNAQNSNAQASNTQTSNTQTSNAQTSSVHAQTSSVNVGDTSSPASDIPISENSSKRLWRVDGNEFDIDSLEYDPGLRPQIWEYDVNHRDEIRRAYIRAGPYRPTVKDYPKSKKKIIFVAFNLRGTIYFHHGLNIHLKKMQHFVYPAFFLISHLDILHNVYSL